MMGRHVLASLASSIASDPGDPLLTAAILAWNATHLPWTNAWYQFPIFSPTPDALALSEHLLGVSVIAAPIQWLTGSPLVAYNLTVLLTYPLSGLAMFALVRRLTGSSRAAFLAGLAYAFAPFRTGHLPHIQMLVSFGMPLALLGLHEYLDSRRRAWLVLFAVSWLLQGAANGYYLVYFTGVVALWVTWFMALRGRWRDVLAVASVLIVASVPLVPILFRYVAVQRELGLSRNIGEIAEFGADIAALLCAPARLTFWGWLRVACVPEGELFAGVGLIALCLAGAIFRLKAEATDSRSFRLKADATDSRSFRLKAEATDPQNTRGFHLQVEGNRNNRLRVFTRRTALAIALLYGAIALVTFLGGPWRIDFPLRASASSVDKPVSVAFFFLLLSALLSRRFQDMVRRGSVETFYLLCAVVCWVLSWGPFPRLFGEPALYQAPYAWFARLPGGESLRVPARLWMLAALCLIVFMGLGVARLLGQCTKRRARFLTVAAALALVADGFTMIQAAAIPPAPLVPPTGKTVLFLPVGQVYPDIAAVYHAITQRYRSINGYSGYQPPYYEALAALSSARDSRLFLPFVDREDLHVLVRRDDVELRTLVASQPGAQLVLEGPVAHYRVPARAVTPVHKEPTGIRVPVQAVDATCAPEGRALTIDGNLRTRWICGARSPDQSVTADLGALAQVGAIVHAMGPIGIEFPRQLVVETSEGGMTWTKAWEGSPAAAVMFAALAKPRESRALLEFAPRTARYVRLRQLARDALYPWSLAELEVWSGQ